MSSGISKTPPVKKIARSQNVSLEVPKDHIKLDGAAEPVDA